MFDRYVKKLTKEIWLLSYPTMISFAMQSFYDLVDMAWVGRISKEALSGVTIFSTIYYLFTVSNEIAGAGSVSMISQSYGRGDRKRTQLIAEQTISFKIVLALISIGLMLLFVDPMISFYTGDAAVRESALRYGYIRIFFIPMMFSSYSVNTIFRCTHDSKTPMKIMLISAVLNLILDPIFMFKTIPGTAIPGLNLGVFGAALATVTAATISFLYGFIILITGRRDVTISLRGLLKLDLEVDRRLFEIGFPSGLQVLVRQFFSAVMIKFVTVYGTAAIALTGISGKLSGFFLMPIFGLNNAGATLVGSALGRDDIKEADLLARISSRLNASIIFLIVLGAAIFAEPLMGVFSSDAAVIQSGVTMIRILAVAQVIIAYNFGKKIVFSGSGYNRPQLIATFISRWFVQLPAMYAVIYLFALPLDFLWISMVIAEVMDFFVIEYFYRQGRWKHTRAF